MLASTTAAAFTKNSHELGRLHCTSSGQMGAEFMRVREHSHNHY